MQPKHPPKQAKYLVCYCAGVLAFRFRAQFVSVGSGHELITRVSEEPETSSELRPKIVEPSHNPLSNACRAEYPAVTCIYAALEQLRVP